VGVPAGCATTGLGEVKMTMPHKIAATRNRCVDFFISVPFSFFWDFINSCKAKTGKDFHFAGVDTYQRTIPHLNSPDSDNALANSDEGAE
jgi:hypothetical protein